MKTRWSNAVVAVLSLLVGSCSTGPTADERLTEALKPVREAYAPDRRTAVFTVVPEWQNGRLVAKGEVDNAKAKADALEALRAAAERDVIDSIFVLPDPKFADKHFGIVTVSVGNMRSRPGHPEELATQVLMGMVVRILKDRGGWYYVQSHDNYLGWLEASSLVVTDRGGVDEWAKTHKLIVTDYFGIVRAQPTTKAMPVTDVVAGVLLKQGKSAGSWMGVSLPDGRTGYIERGIVEDYAAWRKTRRLTPENVEKVAKLFVGVPYLWGGTSAKGFDCSGYTKTVYRLNGLELDRDANQQATTGEEIPVGADFQGLKKGDLMFFGRKATEEKPERIWHVGIYLGNKEFIHCAGRVRVNSFDPSAPHYDPDRLETFVRARRVIGISQIPEVG